jgi:exo-beta-1,3-glucanase (GH17 family)
MKNKNDKFKKISVTFLLIISLGIMGYSQQKIENLGADNLLMDVSRAVCYSGFRAGQHPDRGDGAKNPSYEEVLEDLKILSHNSYFKLIRVYDCGENSEMVLKVIAENNIDIKVMLGIWLKAEISNHEGCPWLNEPITNEVLENNKILNSEELD